MSRGGAVITGGCLFLWSFYRLLKQEKFQFAQFFKNQQNGKYFFSCIIPKKQKNFSVKNFLSVYRCELLFCLVVGFAVLSMVFMGGTSAVYTRILIPLQLIAFVNNLLNFWFYGNLLFAGLFNFFDSPRSMMHSNLELFYLAVMMFLLWKNRNILLQNFKAHKIFWSCAGIFCLTLGIAGTLLITVPKHPAYAFYALLVIYILPILTLLCSIPQTPVMKKTCVIFLVSALCSAIFFSTVVMSVVYALNAFLILVLFVKQFTDEMMAKKKIFAVYGLLAISLFSFVQITNWQFLFSHTNSTRSPMVLQKISYLEKPFEFHSVKDIALTQLHQIKGNRIHYNIVPKKNVRCSISVYFLSKGYEKLGYEKIKY